MAGAEIIGAAIGVLLLILVGYLLIGSALTTAEVVTSAQKDITIQNEARLQTTIAIIPINWLPPTRFTLKNTGQEPISDFTHIDVVLFSAGNSPDRYSYDNTGSTGWSNGTITPDIIHPGMLDPREQMVITVANGGATPSSVQVICANGVYAYNSS